MQIVRTTWILSGILTTAWILSGIFTTFNVSLHHESQILQEENCKENTRKAQEPEIRTEERAEQDFNPL